MSTIHNKVEDDSFTVAADKFTVTSPSTAITSATTAIVSACTTTTATISGTAIWSGMTGHITSIKPTGDYSGNLILRLDSKQTDEQAFRLPWGKVVSIPHDELIKYIGERDLRESNELVRTLWDRYQTAVKLIWSEDDEQEK